VSFNVPDLDSGIGFYVDLPRPFIAAPFDIPVGRVAVAADPFGNVLVLVDLTKGRYSTDAEGDVTDVGPPR
jgi:predicted enzyme related to lactoylglutathione lyase